VFLYYIPAVLGTLFHTVTAVAEGVSKLMLRSVRPKLLLRWL
jgi:hypothetical protein